MRKKSCAILIAGIVLVMSGRSDAGSIDGWTGKASTAPAIVPVQEETISGTIASVDERNDKVTVRLPSDETTDLKVGDGLLFNALRYGDAVRVTVRTIGGSKEIVGVVRE